LQLHCCCCCCCCCCSCSAAGTSAMCDMCSMCKVMCMPQFIVKCKCCLSPSCGCGYC
jgi:hypothetical protein